MRVLFVTPYYKPAWVYGGPVRSIPALCESLGALGVSVSVCTTDANGTGALPGVRGTRCVDGVEVQYCRRQDGGTWYYSSDLARLCREQARDFDLIYVYSNWCYPLIPACRAARAASVPCIVSPRSSFMAESWKRNRFQKLAYHLLVERALINGASALHYTSSLELEQSRWLRLRPRPFVIPNPVNLAELQTLPARGAFRRRHGIPDGETVVLYLGRLEERKGLDAALPGFAGMPGTSARLVIAGPDEDGRLAGLRMQAQALGIAGRVVFTGMLGARQRIQALTDADIFLLPSRSENFGVAAVEAMAAGLPVILSDRVGIAPELSRADAGIVVRPDARAISGALTVLASSSEKRRILGQRGARLARALFAPEAVGQRMLEKFRAIGAARGQMQDDARVPSHTPQESAGCVS